MLEGVRLLPAFIAIALGCGGTQRTPLSRGGDNDEGAGELAQASMGLRTPDGSDDSIPGFDDDARRSRALAYGYSYGGNSYGGDPYGGDSYGGASYSGWRMPQWNYATPNRTPHYQINVGLTGSIEGAVTWNGPPAQKLASSPCGPMDNPTLRVSTDKRMRGVIVFIEKITVGRPTPYYTRPATVGGLLAKHGCTLAPAAQIVAPLPGSVAIHGDTQRTKVRVTPPKGTAKVEELEEAGLVAVEVSDGVTRVDSEDGKLAAAWVLGLTTPYFAITDDNGRYRIDELSPGTYEVTFWQPPITSIAANGSWAYGAPIVLRRRVTVSNKTTAQLSVVLSPPR
jgi:hypothetical protein